MDVREHIFRAGSFRRLGKQPNCSIVVKILLKLHFFFEYQCIKPFAMTNFDYFVSYYNDDSYRGLIKGKEPGLWFNCCVWMEYHTKIIIKELIEWKGADY